MHSQIYFGLEQKKSFLAQIFWELPAPIWLHCAQNIHVLFMCCNAPGTQGPSSKIDRTCTIAVRLWAQNRVSSLVLMEFWLRPLTRPLCAPERVREPVINSLSAQIGSQGAARALCARINLSPRISLFPPPRAQFAVRALCAFGADPRGGSRTSKIPRIYAHTSEFGW